MLNSIKPAYDQRRPNAFNRLDQYTSSSGNRAYSYAELAVSSLAVAQTIATTYCVHAPGMVRPGWLVIYRGGNGMPTRRRSPIP